MLIAFHPGLLDIQNCCFSISFVEDLTDRIVSTIVHVSSADSLKTMNVVDVVSSYTE